MAFAVAAAQTPAIKGFAGFKRIKVSDSFPGKRITVQIDPAAQAAYAGGSAQRWTRTAWKRPLPEAAVLAPVTPEGARNGWFWDKVPVGIADKDGRFPLAMAALGLGPEGQACRGRGCRRCKRWPTPMAPRS